MNKTIKKQFWITPEDDEILKLKCEKACLSEAALMRYLIRGYEPREKPDERFYKSMNDLSAIGRNINQIVAKANTLNFVDAPLLTEELNKLKALRTKNVIIQNVSFPFFYSFIFLISFLLYPLEKSK